MDIESELLGYLRLVEIHGWCDGPIEFTLRSEEGKTYLAYYFDDECEMVPGTKTFFKNSITYFLIETSMEKIEAMLNNEFPVRDMFYSNPNIYLHTEYGKDMNEKPKTLKILDIHSSYFNSHLPYPDLYYTYVPEENNGKQN